MHVSPYLIKTNPRVPVKTQIMKGFEKEESEDIIQVEMSNLHWICEVSPRVVNIKMVFKPIGLDEIPSKRV